MAAAAMCSAGGASLSAWFSFVGESMRTAPGLYCDSYAAMATGVGARLGLCAALAPDLGVPAPPPSHACELRSLAPLVAGGLRVGADLAAGLHVGAASLQEAVQRAGASVHGYAGLPLQVMFPFAAGPVTQALGDCRHKLFLLGIAAGVTMYAFEDGILYSTEARDNGDSKLQAVVPPGDGSGLGGGGGGNNNDDHERYLLLLKLLLELCQGGEGEEARSNFQRLKQLMQREWFELHRKKEQLKVDKMNVDVDKEENRMEREKLERSLEVVRKALSAIAKREQKLGQDLEDLAANKLKLKADRAELDEKLRLAGLDRKELDDLLFRAKLDESTVRRMWKDLEAEQEKRKASAGTGEDSSSKGGSKAEGSQGGGSKKAAGGPEEDGTSGFWPLLWSIIDFPNRMHGSYGSWSEWGSNTYWAAYIFIGAGGRIMELDEAGLRQILDNLRKKREADRDKVGVILDDFGLPRPK